MPTNPRAAVLRDEAGAIVGTTCGDTQCWFPREPSKLVSFGDDGRETIIRCRFCLGCREFERRELARRLVETYHEEKRDLWQVSIQCPLENQAELVSRLKRSRIVNFSSAFYRLGSNAVALIVAGEKPRLCALKALRRCTVSCVMIRRSRGSRAFSALTSGILARRDEYGRWTNRYYHRGLKPRDRAVSFTRATRFTRGIGHRHKLGDHKHSVRAWKAGVTIHLPDAIRVPRLRRRLGPVEHRVGGGLRNLETLITGTALALSILSPAAKPRPTLATGVGIIQRRLTTGSPVASVLRNRSRASAVLLNQEKQSSYSAERYSGSRQFSTGEIDAWAARMAAIAAKRAKPPD